METKNELFTKYPNEVFDSLSSQGLPLTAYLSPAEEKVLNRCIRMANGWHRTKFRMSLREMAQLTGLSTQGVVNCINSLTKAKLIFYDASSGVGIWTLDLHFIKYALEYYASNHPATGLLSNKKKVRTTQLDSCTTELYSNKVEDRTTELDSCTTELYTNDETVQLSCTPSNKEITTKEIKETTTTSATQNVAYEVVEVVTSQATTQDNLIISYCEALQWDIRQKDNNRKATKAISELKALYPSITSEEITNVINHANQVYKLKPTQLAQQWLKLSNEVAMMQDAHLTEIAQAIKGIYSLNGNTPYAKLFEIYGVASQAKLYQLQASDFAGFTSKWPSNLNLPGLDKLLTNVAKVKGETNNVREIKGDDSGKRGAIDSSIFASLERAKGFGLGVSTLQ